MLPLDLMKAFFETVDSGWCSPLADEIASRWQPGAKDVRVLRASANFVCTVKTPACSYILRFNHANQRQPAAIAAELAFVNHLADCGLHVARPQPSLAGQLIESLPTTLGTFHAVLFEALDGEQWDFEALSLEQFASWGQALGELHNASQGLVLSDRPDWQAHLSQARRFIPPEERAAWREMECLQTRLATLPTGPEAFGLVHYDFELDNLFWNDEQAGVIDFDDCARYWLAADVAYALRDLYHDHARDLDLADPRFQVFLGGYRAVRSLPDDILQHLGLFVRLHNLVTFARHYMAVAGGAPAAEPGWCSRLRDRLNAFQDQCRQDFQDDPLEAWPT
jgi:Ser/Thr protein kinase RdoA (MazF antagonist)